MRDSRLASTDGCAATRRDGSVMVMVLACMAVAAAIAATMLHTAVTARRSLRAELHLRQVERLLEAASAEARARLTAGTQGDASLLLEAPHLADAGTARIGFAPASEVGMPAIRVSVEFPLHSPATIRRTRLVFSSAHHAIRSKESQP